MRAFHQNVGSRFQLNIVNTVRFFSNQQRADDSLKSIICRQLRLSGPISVADYMQLALHHPKHGYYKNSEVIGSRGDFITSPEISQIFGELLGIWVVNEWLNNNKKNAFNIVEFGPGRGTLLTTLLRTLHRFPESIAALQNIYLIERSDRLRKVQEANLSLLFESVKLETKVSWNSSIDEIPQGVPTYYLAHEFFDALPIHQFQKTGGKWYEVFVDVTESSSDPLGERLVFVSSKKSTLAMHAYLNLAANLDTRTCIEVCPEAGGILQKVARRIASDGGGALIIDYGHCGELNDTFRGFKNHKPHDPLKDPGLVDLTADVDFGFFRRSVDAAQVAVTVHGPVTQAYFLIHMGFLARLKILVENTKSIGDRRNLMTASETLIKSDQMGKRFKFMAILPSYTVEGNHIPAGFFPTWTESTFS